LKENGEIIMESVDNKSLKILKVMRKNNMAYTNSQLEDVTPESINLEDIINSLRYLQNLEYIEKFQGGKIKTYDFYSITQKGIALLDERKRTLHGRIIDHIAFPIIVAFVTSAIVAPLVTLLTLMLSKM
jgi:predicted transcriptional regulator